MNWLRSIIEMALRPRTTWNDLKNTRKNDWNFVRELEKRKRWNQITNFFEQNSETILLLIFASIIGLLIVLSSL